MAAYAYQALDERGRNRQGTLEADSPRQARQLLREQGLIPIEVTEAAEQVRQDRITSYNVCYTKLLRKQIKATPVKEREFPWLCIFQTKKGGHSRPWCLVILSAVRPHRRARRRQTRLRRRRRRNCNGDHSNRSASPACPVP